ncbi:MULTISPECIES: phosphonate metabolism protein/1,5-bisphosphokinase (PRPP-forming) PhnN [unclassified Variovorax]|jgi:ribose 1,5-bisphosphokinase|uniref:phosphonate metabolism protein/1,5-bisphosphokinase (PRPP-forming) PhnN n=1 Tax=unclassified Variovorax TaxID=663243 RepID=UPI000F7E4B6C|nr:MULTISPECIES: phosphonate metabolism protein/1,5-bisphosphokinase (PRPP-forming) PhnN [unclassified Variovorax]RSZ42664.1 phosphonate metabolism protein/1,5-bisphosphokinase (PRPP-forming) PhnN [Variovorax sp. 553]RSZ43638.1 phosphonate metabolism protein/1,5-bisphosphokinase (PRPP-forming) PhnN [Variovorax sp. 679]
MTGRLVYVAGPSGAGKDSLLGWLKEHLPHDAPVAFARRTITRAVAAGGEQHDSVDVPGFLQLRGAGAFGLDWEANGLCYGVRHAELVPPRDDGTVIVNGSRAYLPQAARRFPHMTVVHVTASVETLRSRLMARGRESAEMVEARVRRALDFRIPPGLAAIEIHNEDVLADAGARLLQALRLPRRELRPAA